MPPRGYGRAPGSYGQPHDPYRQQQLLRLVLILAQQVAAMERKPPATVLLALGERGPWRRRAARRALPVRPPARQRALRLQPAPLT